MTLALVGLSAPWLVSRPAAANVPAAYFACEGAAELDECRQAGAWGQCVLDTRCTDDDETPWNECLLCGDGCRGLAEDAVCVRPDRSIGVCRPVEGPCEPDPDRSFDRCQRCEAGRPPSTEARAAGCAATDAAAAGPWALVLLLVARERRRRRPRGP